MALSVSDGGGNAPAGALNVDQLAVHLRLSADTESVMPLALRTVLTDLLDSAKAQVEEVAPEAPQVLKNRAIIQICGYQNEMPAAPAGAGFASVLRNSGALAILKNHVPRRAMPIEAA